MQIATLGIDIGNVWFHVVGLDFEWQAGISREAEPTEAHAPHRQ